MMDIAIFLFGTVVTLIVGAAMSSLIVWKNKAEEGDDSADRQAPQPVPVVQRRGE